MKTLLLTLTTCLFVLPANAKYSGGTGEPNDPYRVATAEDLMLLGETPEDYDKHFILTADIDLDPNLPGRKVFDRAVIAPDINDVNWHFDGTPFSGVFNGNGHVISHLTITGRHCLGLFGSLSSAAVSNLGLVDVKIAGSGGYVGGLAGCTVSAWERPSATVANSYSTGAVSGTGGYGYVGGLVGYNEGTVANCYSTCTVSGDTWVGGLAGGSGTLTGCHSTGVVSGNWGVGGLAGHGDNVTNCYSSAAVTGKWCVGGLVGQSEEGSVVTCCCSTGVVNGEGTVGGLVGSNIGAIRESYAVASIIGNSRVGGLVGTNGEVEGYANFVAGTISDCYSASQITGSDSVGGLVGNNVAGQINSSLWDIETSGQATSDGGTGKTTAEMQTATTFLEAGWDFVGETANGSEDIWKIAEGLGYPRLSWEKYSGGTGEPNDPYQIATAADLIALGETPEDYDKHFILTADIDLDPNLPGGRIFDGAVIAPVYGTPFRGVFDGKGHTISHLTIKREGYLSGYLGLFGQLGRWDAPGGEVKNLGVVDVNVTGSGYDVGALVGSNSGTVTQCYSTVAVSSTGGDVGGLVGRNYKGTVTQCHSSGTVSGASPVGGLVGHNGYGSVTASYSTGVVSGTGGDVGGLVGENSGGTVTHCHSTSAVSGVGPFSKDCGGLVGYNTQGGTITECYSTGAVSGQSEVGGLVGQNSGGVIRYCYSTGSVSGRDGVGGLLGSCYSPCSLMVCDYAGVVCSYSSGRVMGDTNVGGLIGTCYAYVVCSYSAGRVVGDTNVGGLVGGGHGEFQACLWDTQASAQAMSIGGTGKTTAQMTDIRDCRDAGFDFVGTDADGTCGVWQMPAEGGYPILAVFSGYTPPQLQGSGTQEDPYLVSDADELGAMAYYSPSAQYRLTASIDLSGIRWGTAVIPWFSGTFDGSGHTISHLTIRGGDYLGLFGRSGGTICSLGIVDVNIASSGNYVGGLAGYNKGGVTQCYSIGAVTGDGNDVGGLVGYNEDTVVQCSSSGPVSGNHSVGGLVGRNDRSISTSYSTGAVTGDGNDVGGLVGYNEGGVTQCYSTATVDGSECVGGLVGNNYCYYCSWPPGLAPCPPCGSVTQCFSTGMVTGDGNAVGGLVGCSDSNTVTASFWDTQTSGQATSAGGTGKITAEMLDPNTFMAAGWDFVAEVDGRHDIWAEPEGGGYPILWWQLPPGFGLPTFSGGKGEPNDPYLISTAEELNSIGQNPRLMQCHFKLIRDLDLTGLGFYPIGGSGYPYTGVFDGDGHTVSHLTITGESYLGMFNLLGRLDAPGGEVKNLGLLDVNITGSGDCVGGLVGYNSGNLTGCYSSGTVSSTGWRVGGLVGFNWYWWGTVTQCYSTAVINGYSDVGGLVGENRGTVTRCYSAGAVSGKHDVGGLVGANDTTVVDCFWDIQTSGQATSAGATGKTTVEMQTAKTFLDAGWDFVGETANGTEDIWWILEGKDYPRLWWETTEE